MKKRVLSLFLAIALCLTLTPTGALAAEGQPPEQTVSATQEAETPTPAPQKEEPTAPAENGADENASPASPDEKPTENTPAAAEKNSADEEPGKEPAAATGKDESKADGSPSDDDAAKVQNQLVMAAAAGPDEPTMMGQNDLLALADEGQTPANAQNSEGGGIYVPPGSTTEGAGGIYVSEEDTRTEIWCTSKPSSIQRGYDDTTDGSTIPIDLTFTDGTKTFTLKERTDFTAKKTFDSADAGWHTVNVEIELIGDAAAKYKLKTGQETFTIDGYINKAHPDLTVSLSKAACTVGEKILPLLSVEGAPDGAAVTYYYTQYKSIAGSSEYEGIEAMPAIDGNTAISVPGTYYVYAKTDKTKNYEEGRSTTVELTVNEAVVEAASVTKPDGTVSGTYKTLPEALNAAQDGDTVKLLENHTTNWSDVEAGEYATLAAVKSRITLDLNGHTVDYLVVGEVVSDEAGGILETYEGNLTVADNIQGGSHGKIEYLEFVKGSLAIQGGQIGDSNGSRLTCNENSGSVTISGGTVLGLEVGEGDTVAVSGGTVLGLKVNEGAAVTVNDGSAHAGNWFNDGTLSITGGTFKDVQFVNSGTIAISGGTFEKISNNDTNTPQPLMLLLAKDCAFVNENNTSDVQDGTKTSLTEVMVKEHTHTFENGKCGCGVASIVVDNNNSCYNTLQAALNAAANNASITSVTLGQDLTENVTFNRSAAGALTLNMNGHKLEAEAGVPLTVIGGELIIEGAGQVNQNTASNANPFPAISLTGGKLVIAGDLTAQGGYNSSNGRKPAIRAEEEGELDLQGNVSLNGGLTILDNAKLTNLLTKGTFYAQDPNGNPTKDNVLARREEGASSDNYNTVLKLIADGYAIYKADDTVINAAAFTLNSDTYSIGAHTCSYTNDEAHGIAFCKCGRSHAHRDLSEEKSVLVNGVCPICGYHCPHKNIGNDGVCTDCNAKMVAKVTVGETTTYTADLADALNKAANGTTITLLADTEISADVNIYDETATGADQMVVTLDLAGHTVTSGKPIAIGADRNGPGSHYGTLKIVGTGNITLDYVTLDTREKGVLDLNDWTGKSISSVTVTRIGNTNEGKLIVGKDAGHIGRLAFAFVNCPSAEITNTKLYGGSYGEITTITIGSGTPSLAGLLPNGCAFKNADGSFADATASNLFNVTVSACDHGGKNGFDKDAATCPYCGAPAVAETALNNGEGSMLWRRFADLQTAIDADRDGGAEFTLLTDVTGDYTINGTQNTALNLNGHSIKGTVTVKGTKGDFITTTLSNTKNTTTVSIDKVVAFDGAELAGSKYPAVIGTLTLAEGAKWNNILNGTALGYKVLNADGTHKWYAQDDVKVSQLNNVIINRLPITSKTLYLKVGGKNLTGSSPKVERGTTVQLCASCNAKDANVSIYIGETVGNSLPIYRQKKAEYKKIGTSWYYVVDLDANTIGTYDIYFTASKDGYKVTSAHKKLTVTKPNLSNAEITFPYGNEAAFNYATATGVPTFVVTYKGQTLEKDVDFTITSGDSFSGVGPCTLTIKATDNGDYTGSQSAQWNVRPLKVAASVGDIIKTYDGTTNLPENTTITFKSADSYYTGATLRLAKGTDYEVLNAKYDSANASTDEKTVSFTIKLKNAGYVFEDGTTQKDFTLNGAELNDKTFKIDKATIASDPQLYQTVFNDLEKIYEIDLNQALNKILPEGSKYGDIVYGKPGVSMYADYYPAGGATIRDGTLRLSINKATGFKQGKEIGTVAVEVETTNYQPFTLTIHVSVQDKLVPVPAKVNPVSAKDITYGQTLADSELTVNGTMQDRNTLEEVKGTFAWTNKDFKPDASDSYEAEWTFTPDEDYEEYATVTGTVTIKVNKADPTFTAPTAQENLTYTGSEQALLAAGSTQDGTMKYRLGESGEFVDSIPNGKDAGTYTVYYKVVGDKNHNDTAEQSITVTIKPLPISLLSVSSISKTYDGSADVTLTADKLTFFSKTAKATNIKLPDTALSFSDAQFTKQQEDGSYLPSPEVGNGKALSFTMTLTSSNYVFEGKSEGTVSDVFATDDVNRFTITKAAAPTMQPIELTVINGLAKTYLVNLPALPTLGDNCKYGSIKYETCNFDLIGEGGYANSMAMITSNDEFQLAVPAVESQTEGSVGTVGVKITTDNYQDMLLTIEVIAKNKIVPVLDGEITATPITFGQILRVSTITGTMKDDGKTVEGTFEWTNPSTQPDKVGDYQAEWTFTPAEGYEEYATVTGTVTIKVNKADPAFIAPTAQENLTYTGQEQALITAGMTDHGTMQYSLTENGTYSQDIPTGTDAGTYTVWYRVFGDPNHNDTAPASVTVRIGQKPLTITGVTVASKSYDGTTNADISGVTFDNVTLNQDTDYTVTASFDDASVGERKSINATVSLMEQIAKNYFLEQNSFLTTGSITKAAAPTNIQSGTLTITNGLHKTYSFDLSTLLPKLTAPCDYGTITYDKKVDTNLGVGSFITLVNGKTGELTLEANRSGTNEGQFGTITVTISTSNYQDINLTVNVSAVNQIKPVSDGTITAADITYGDALSKSEISGKMKDSTTGKEITGTFTWTDGTVKPNVGSHNPEWTFTPDESYGGKYTTKTGTAPVKVNPKAVTVSGITAKDKVYDGKTNATLDCSNAKLNGVLENDTLTVTATGTFESANAGEQKVTISGFKLDGDSVANNYVLAESGNQTETTATITAREATVTPDDNQFKVYEEKDPDLTYNVRGVLDGETLKGITLTRAEGENAGEYAITATADAGANPNYDVTLAKGKFTINPKPIDSATVKLGAGLIANGAEQTQTVEKVLLDGKELPADSYTVTDNTATAPGSYTLTITGKGNYTGTVKQTYAIAPAKAEDAPGEEITIGIGKVNVNVQSEGAVPPAALLTDKAELLAMLVDSGDITADELAQIANGASVDIVLTVKEANVPDEVKAAMAQAAKGYTIGQYLDISLFKYMTVNGSQQAGVALHTTKDVLTISVVVPDALINTNSAVNRTYCIVRNHEGTITVLDAAFDAASKTLTFKTDRFSIYAIAYKDTAVPSSGSNPGSNNSSNDSETKKNEVAAPTPTPTPASTSKPSTITAMPQTGDTSNPTLYVVLLVASLLGLAVVFVCKKRNDK